MYVAFVSYRTRAVDNSWIEGFRTADVDEGTSTTEILNDILQAVSEHLNVPLDDLVAISFNILPATVGGDSGEELA